MPVLVLEVVDEAAADLGLVGADVGVEGTLLFGGEGGGSETVELEELFGSLHGAVVGTEERIAVGVDACRAVGEDGTHGVAFASGIGGVFCHRLVEDFILIDT